MKIFHSNGIYIYLLRTSKAGQGYPHIMKDTVTARLRRDHHVTHMCWMLTAADRAPCLLVFRSCKCLEPLSRSQTTRWRQNNDCSNSWPEQPRTKPPTIASFLPANQGWTECSKLLTSLRRKSAYPRSVKGAQVRVRSGRRGLGVLSGRRVFRYWYEVVHSIPSGVGFIRPILSYAFSFR